MAYLDAHNQFSDAQSVAATDDTVVSTNLIDLTATDGEIGVGQPIYFEAVVTTALVGAAATIAVAIQQDADAAFSDPTTIQTIGTFAALSAIGTRLRATIAPGAISERFIRVLYTVTNTVTSNIDAHLVLDLQEDKEYPDGFTIS